MHRKNQNKYRLSLLSLFVLLMISCLGMAGCGIFYTRNNSTSNLPSPNSSSASTGPSAAKQSNTAGTSKVLHIVAAEDFYGEAARAVGGSFVKVQSIIDNPNVDPHDFTPTPDTAKAVNSADVIIANGAGYDAWIEKLIKTSSHAGKAKTIKVANDLMGKKEGDNEHVWYNPKTIPALADRLAEILGKLDPAHADSFSTNAKQYIAALQPIQQLADRLKQPKPVSVDTSEPVFDYMLQAMNFKVNDPHFELAINEGNDPSPQDMAQLQNDIKSKNIPFFVENIQNDSPMVKHIVSLAQQNGIPVLRVTETKPAGKDYVQWMTGQLQQLEKIYPGK